MFLHFDDVLVEVFLVKGEFGLKGLPLLLCGGYLVFELLVLALLDRDFALKVLD